MKKTISLENLVNDPGCLSEYDPNAMTIEVARKYIHDFLTVNLGTEYVNTEDALDRILGETLISKINVPNYNNSAMDGFAFNLASLIEKNTLKVATTILAGDLSKQKIKPGFAAQIMTGSKIPDGTDTVLPFWLKKIIRKFLSLIQTFYFMILRVYLDLKNMISIFQWLQSKS